MSNQDQGSRGSYSVVKATSYKCGWKLKRKYFVDGEARDEIIPIDKWQALGFSHAMTIDQARGRASQLNTEKKLDTEKARKSALRVAKLEVVESAFLPDYLVTEFSAQLVGRRHQSDAHKKKLLSHWLKLRALILFLQTKPEEYSENEGRIYDWFAANAVSPEYAMKLIGLLNRWGALSCKKAGSFYEPVKMPKGKDRAAIADAYQDSDSFQGESDPLTPQMLDAKCTSLSEENYRWLYVSVWFGLRPEEIDGLKTADNKLWKVEKDRATGVDVLWVYQPKLVGLERSKRWKPIPIIFKEQTKAISYINEGLLQRPTYKKLHSVFGEKVRLYGGRKGFQDLMLDRGQTLENISVWMGHQDISRTWKSYRNKRRVSFNKPA